jgi:PAS domain S-box-containing protein
MNKINIKHIITNKLFRPMIIVYGALSLALYLYIPSQMDRVLDDYIKANSIELLSILDASKKYYNTTIINKIQHTSDVHIVFTKEYKDKNNTLPLPAIFLKDISKMTNPKRIINLYSDTPFKNNKDRVLTPTQIRIINTLKNKKDGFVIEKTNIDGKDYIRVAKADYMTNITCVNCHNNHKNRMWNKNRWAIGDMVGVLEIITPIDETVRSQLTNIRNHIVWFVLLSFFILFVYYGYIIIHREEELIKLNKKLEFEFSEESKKITLKNLALEHNISSIYLDFDSTVIYSKTNLFGTITDVSEAFCKISGYSRDELLGQKHNIVRHKDMKSEVFEEMWDTIDAGKIWKGDLKNKTKDGGFYWVRSIISPNFDIDGIKIGYTSIRQDITKEKQQQIYSLKLKLKGYKDTE